MMEHDVIYLQAGGPTFDPTDWSSEGVTWCADIINDDDIKYLLATPEREAAPDLLKALTFAKSLLEESILWTAYVDEHISPAIAQATPLELEEEKKQ